MLMLSRNALVDIQGMSVLQLGGLETFSVYANSIDGDLTKVLEMVNKSCPALANLNIEANPLVDAF